MLHEPKQGVYMLKVKEVSGMKTTRRMQEKDVNTRDEYDFSGAKANPYAVAARRPVTMNLAG